MALVRQEPFCLLCLSETSTILEGLLMLSRSFPVCSCIFNGTIRLLYKGTIICLRELCKDRSRANLKLNPVELSNCVFTERCGTPCVYYPGPRAGPHGCYSIRFLVNMLGRKILAVIQCITHGNIPCGLAVVGVEILLYTYCR